MAILTDGQEWNFFLPGEQGDYGERRVYKLDIVERDVAECALRLTRYLDHSSVVSGSAIEAARSDYKNVSRDRQIKATMPQAWERLVEDEDELLLELIADRVESLCGFKPDPDTVADFLRALPQPLKHRLQTPTPRPREPISVGVPPKEPTNYPASVGFTLDERFHPTRNATDTLISVFEAFQKRDTSFSERFAALPKHGRTRRYLARNPDDLYPGRPDLVHDHSKQLSSGWWLSTNNSRRTIAQIIEMAANVMRLRFGKDIRIELGE